MDFRNILNTIKEMSEPAPAESPFSKDLTVMSLQQFVSGEGELDETESPITKPDDYGVWDEKSGRITQRERDRRSGTSDGERMTQGERERRATAKASHEKMRTSEATVLGRGMSPAARQRDIDQSDIEYIEQRKAKMAAKKADLMGASCKSCGTGKYKETSQMDDMDGVLHCTSCGEKVDRHSTVDEAKLGGVTARKFDEPELTSYLDRITDKTKDKQDKYKRPYIHGGNIPIVNDAGKKYDLDKLRAAVTERPAKILKQNEKMQHSDGTSSIFYNIGLPALKGLAVDEDTGDFVIIDTCPGAGQCKTYCYAMKGGYVQWKATSMSQSRLLNFLYNDPDGFMAMLSTEVAKAEKAYGKKGTKVIVRWHDAGDFFSPEYLALAYAVARKFPDVDFYAYTKLADVAQGAKPDNFKINFSMGALPAQEKRIDFHKTKHSKVVPKELFSDLIAKEDGKLKKDARGRMQFASPQDEATFKQRMAAKYSIDPKTILRYDEMMQTKDDGTPRWNVIVMPGDGDDSANRHDVLGSYLVIH